MLEAAAGCTTILTDKSGTLTTNKMEVTKTWSVLSDPAAQLLAPSGANQKSFPRGVPMQHLAPRRNPELSNGHLIALD